MEDLEQQQLSLENLLEEKDSTLLFNESRGDGAIFGAPTAACICTGVDFTDTCGKTDIVPICTCGEGDAVTLISYSWMFVWAIWCSGSTREGLGNNPVAGAYPLVAPTTNLMCTPNSGSTPNLWRDNVTMAAFQSQPNRQYVNTATYFWKSGTTLASSQISIATGIRSASTVTASIYAPGHTTKHNQLIRVVRYCVNTNTTTFTKYAPVSLFGTVAYSVYASWATKIRLPQGHYRFITVSDYGERLPCAEIGFYSNSFLNRDELKFFVAKTGSQLGEVIFVSSATTSPSTPARVCAHRQFSDGMNGMSDKTFYFSSGGTYYLYVSGRPNSHLLRLTDIMDFDDAYSIGYTRWDYGLGGNINRVSMYDGNMGQADDFYGLDSDIYGYYGLDPASLNYPMCIPSTFYKYGWTTPSYYLNQDTGLNSFGTTQLQRAAIQTSKGYRVRGMVLEGPSGLHTEGTPIENACVVTQGISGKTDETGWFDFYVPLPIGATTVYGPNNYYYPATYNDLYQLPSVITLNEAP